LFQFVTLFSNIYISQGSAWGQVGSLTISFSLYCLNKLQRVDPLPCVNDRTLAPSVNIFKNRLKTFLFSYIVAHTSVLWRVIN